MILMFLRLFPPVLLGLAGCGGGGGNDSRADLRSSGNAASRTSAAEPASAQPLPDHGLRAADADEIVPLLDPIPPGLAEDRVLPEDPAAFRRKIFETMKNEPNTDVLPMIDVVLLLNPDDHEMREIRANLLLRQGFREDAAVDFALCCKGGRSACCR